MRIKIFLDHLKISHLFKKVYTPDSGIKTGISKSEMVSDLMKENSLNPKETIFVGDTSHDGIAANENKIDFVLAQYGYGNFNNYKYKINSFKNLLEFIYQLNSFIAFSMISYYYHLSSIRHTFFFYFYFYQSKIHFHLFHIYLRHN